MSDLRTVVGNRIRLLRKEKGFTQQDLADRSGLDDAYIGGIERGERNFSIDTLDKVLRGLTINPSHLFTSIASQTRPDAKQEAADELLSATYSLSAEQTSALTRINREIIKTMKAEE